MSVSISDTNKGVGGGSMVWVGWVRIVGLFIRFEIMTYEQVKV
jgi:hypothetical protein